MFKSFFCYGVRLRTKSIITFRVVCFWFQFVEPAKQTIWQGKKICIITSRNISSCVCPVDFDGHREMWSLALKTVVVHESVTS